MKSIVEDKVLKIISKFGKNNLSPGHDGIRNFPSELTKPLRPI